MYLKTVRVRFIFGLAVWRVLLVTKRTLFDSMQMGEDTLFQNEVLLLNNAGIQLPSSNFDGTNRNAEHPVTILKNLLK
jgi:hypothetical protein